MQKNMNKTFFNEKKTNMFEINIKDEIFIMKREMLCSTSILKRRCRSCLWTRKYKSLAELVRRFKMKQSYVNFLKNKTPTVFMMVSSLVGASTSPRAFCGP